MAESGGTGTGIGTVGGRYALVERIGSGAMGVVWRARDELLDREVAVKQLRWPDLTAGEVEVARARAMREARNAARLQHPDAISVFDVVVEDDRPWLVMEYLPSRSLAGLLAGRGGVSPDEAARIGGRVAAALAAAHAAGIVHRDVKPSNVLIGHDGSVKLTDFGISRAAGDGTLTDSGMITGTPAYLAPEVARGEQPSQASDVFSLGATLYAAIEGQSPYGTSDNSFGLLYRAAAGKVEPPTRSGDLTALLTRMLDTDPQVRPTAAEAVDLLAEPTAAEAVEPPAEPTAARARRRWLVPAIVAAVLLVAGGAATAYFQPWRTTYEVAPQQPAYTQEDAAELVRRHYEALPENPDAAYQNLATVFRPTFADYQQTWGQYDQVRAEGIQAVALSPSRFLVDVQVTFIQAGAETTERYQLVLEHTEGRLLIVRSGLLDP
ncbi:serine/threonine-protein kinase [Saccharothrix stipae]